MANSLSLKSATTAKAKHQRGGRVDLWIVITYIILISGVIIAISPFFWMVSASLMTLGEATGRALVPKVPQWQNYAEAWKDANFSEYFVNSVITALITLSGQVVFCTLAA
jgi:ABC-type glycerol-3-phosphate transport system permease component